MNTPIHDHRLRPTPSRDAAPAALENRPDERGQTTAEYALVLLAAGTIAMMVVAWANGTGAIGDLFDAMLSRITSLAG